MDFFEGGGYLGNLPGKLPRVPCPAGIIAYGA